MRRPQRFASLSNAFRRHSPLLPREAIASARSECVAGRKLNCLVEQLLSFFSSASEAAETWNFDWPLRETGFADLLHFRVSVLFLSFGGSDLCRG
jgi:hypothetical protein